MKKIILYALFLSLIPLGMSAQSSMTDEQVMLFVAKEHKSGTSNAQIVTKLMQNGVDISQIRRVRKKYERQINNQGLGTVADETIDKADDRSRKNNGEKKEGQLSNYRLSPGSGYQHSYDENDEEYMTIRQETIHLLGDSIETEAERAKGPKVFGRDIFNKKNLSFEPNMNIATPQNYRLGPGDAVIIDVYGASQKSIQATVSPDGDVTIPDYGPVRVSGLTVAQANARLHSTLGARYSSSKVRLTVGQTKTIMVNVYGEVKAPGTYTLSAFSSVFHALYMAGGTNDLGTLRNIKVYRGNKLVTSVDVYDYILNGKLSGNIRLADNDVIYVGPYDCLVNITGKVKRPMYYEMRKSESVGTLLKYSGGFTGDAYTKSVRLVRKTGREYAVFNVEEFDMNSFRVADGDSVSIDSILPRYANTVEVKGAVFRPGLYQLGGEISSIRGLVTHAEGLTEEAFTNRAVMHRMKSDRSLEVVSVDIAGIMNGTVADIPLRENDILFIPTKPELQTQRTITIHGEVQYPGVYQYADNETIEDFVLQAAGLNRQGGCVAPREQPESPHHRQHHIRDFHSLAERGIRGRRSTGLHPDAVRRSVCAQEPGVLLPKECVCGRTSHVCGHLYLKQEERTTKRYREKSRRRYRPGVCARGPHPQAHHPRRPREDRDTHKALAGSDRRKPRLAECRPAPIERYLSRGH